MQMIDTIDILEDDILELSPLLLKTLLKDQSVSIYQGKETNIFWATNDYAELGAGFGYYDQIAPEKITGKYGTIIQPRIKKSREIQQKRIADKAEVFTPIWICNKQNNLIDSAWFGRENVFNIETNDRIWITNESPIEFSDNKTWKDYVMDTRMEITCGEAPYITSRYDVTTGKFIQPKDRIGLLDRKLRVIGENTTTNEEWILAAIDAYKNIYAYEWQGDNLLLAREAMLWTFSEFYANKFKCEPPKEAIIEIATIISWNVWQMDGLKCVVPNSCKTEVNTDLFGNTIKTECHGCKKGNIHQHNGIYCMVKDWNDIDKKTGEKGAIIPFHTLIK